MSKIFQVTKEGKMKKESNLKLLRVMTPIICFWLVLISCTGQAQGNDERPGLFIGAGVGFGTVKKLGWETGSDSGINSKFQAGVGLSSRASFMIEYEIHHFRDETPELSEIEWDGERPEHFKTYFLLASVQIYMYKGFFIRPSLGFGKQYELFCHWDNRVPPRCTETIISWEVKLAYGISIGYEYKLTQHIGVALEAVARNSIQLPDVLDEDPSTSRRRALSIQVVGAWYF